MRRAGGEGAPNDLGKTRNALLCRSVSVPRTHLHHHGHWTGGWIGGPLRSPPLQRARCMCLSSASGLSLAVWGRSANDTMILEHNCPRGQCPHRGSQRRLSRVTFPQGGKRETPGAPLTLWKGRETQHSLNLHLRAQRELQGVGGDACSLTKGSPGSVLESGNPKHDG